MSDLLLMGVGSGDVAAAAAGATNRLLLEDGTSYPLMENSDFIAKES